MIRRFAVALSLSCAVSACGPMDSDVILDNSTSMSSLLNGGTQFGATIDDVMWYWNVTWNDVKDTPAWVPGEDPAISMVEAIRLAQKEMVKYADSPDAYRVDHVEWLSIGECCRANDDSSRWIYVVDFERTDRFPSGARGTIRIPILLDGRAIQGVKEGAPAERP